MERTCPARWSSATLDEKVNHFAMELPNIQVAFNDLPRNAMIKEMGSVRLKMGRR